jgi:hypothetical protein
MNDTNHYLELIANMEHTLEQTNRRLEVATEENIVLRRILATCSIYLHSQIEENNLDEEQWFITLDRQIKDYMATRGAVLTDPAAADL